jgi:hypothetical protein
VSKHLICSTSAPQRAALQQTIRTHAKKKRRAIQMMPIIGFLAMMQFGVERLLLLWSEDKSN